MSKKDEKTYVLDLTNGTQRKVTVPNTWKITFGPTIPFSGKNGANAAYSAGGGPLCLRFYEGSSKDNLRAAFTDVKAFRDASIEVSERRTETKQQVVAQQGPGGMSNAVVEARITQWVNPDDEVALSRSEEAAAPYLGMMNNLLPAKTY